MSLIVDELFHCFEEEQGGKVQGKNMHHAPPARVNALVPPTLCTNVAAMKQRKTENRFRWRPWTHGNGYQNLNGPTGAALALSEPIKQRKTLKDAEPGRPQTHRLNLKGKDEGRGSKEKKEKKRKKDEGRGSVRHPRYCH